MNPHQLGQYAEKMAAHYLKSCGFLILDSRFRTPRGEVDLVVARGTLLIFVEVKARASPSFGSGAEAVNALKLFRISRVAEEYIHRYNWSGSFRIDVIDFRFSLSGDLIEMNHLCDVTD